VRTTTCGSHLGRSSGSKRPNPESLCSPNDAIGLCGCQKAAMDTRRTQDRIHKRTRSFLTGMSNAQRLTEYHYGGLVLVILTSVTVPLLISLRKRLSARPQSCYWMRPNGVGLNLKLLTHGRQVRRPYRGRCSTGTKTCCKVCRLKW